MGILIAPESAEGRERLKWEYSDHFIGGVPGLRGPRVFQEFPKAMYKAGRPTHGNVAIVDYQEAADSQAQAVYEGQGYRAKQEDALALVHATHVEHAKLAAERHYQEARMSERAQAEAQAVDQETVYHVPVIPEAPIKRRGRPKKIETA